MIKVYCYSRCGTCKKALKWLDELLATDGMLVKRPLVVGDGFVLTGFKVEEWEAKLKN